MCYMVKKNTSMTQRFTNQHKQKPALTDSFLYCEIKKKSYKLSVIHHQTWNRALLFKVNAKG